MTEQKWYNKELLARSIPTMLLALFWLAVFGALLAGAAQTFAERFLHG